MGGGIRFSISGDLQSEDGERVRYSKPEETLPLTKGRVENIFGGIWIEDNKEYAKFASAVVNTPFEEDGEGIAYTDNFFYAYYLNIDGQVIPYASVYLNAEESQDVVDKVNEEIKADGRKRGVREYIDRAYVRTRNLQGKDNVINRIDKSSSDTRGNDNLGFPISRKGRDFERPELYVKTQRADKFGYLEEEETELFPADMCICWECRVMC